MQLYIEGLMGAICELIVFFIVKHTRGLGLTEVSEVARMVVASPLQVPRYGISDILLRSAVGP